MEAGSGLFLYNCTMADICVAGGIFQEAEGDGIPESKDSSEACCRGRSRVTTRFSAYTFWA
jgi:hypothetical protein